MKPSIAILIVEDEMAIRQLLMTSLSTQAYHLFPAGNIAAAETILNENSIDLIILDWMLPDGHGVKWLRKIRHTIKGKDILVLMLTARATEEDILTGFESGADDYLTKPFSPRELQARVGVLLKRHLQVTHQKLSCGDIVFDTAKHIVYVRNKPLDISPTELNILLFFLKKPHKVWTRAQILDHVWGYTSIVEERTVDVHIKRLRQTLATAQVDHYVKTVRGVGYLFDHIHSVS